MYELRLVTNNQLKEMKLNVFNTRGELEFEIKDKRTEVNELK